MKVKKYLLHSVAIALISMSACSKSDFLNEKPRKSLVLPTTLEHFQAILDNDSDINGAESTGSTPQLGESGSDNFYLADAEYNTFLRPQMQNYYIWAQNPYAGISVADWVRPYLTILYANTVLDGLGGIEKTDDNAREHDHIRGQALFHRAHMFWQLAQVFAPAYDPESGNNDLSIVLRLESDINETLRRATVQETYERILTDLSTAIDLLDEIPVHKSRASKPAAYGLLARVYLSMRDYEKAGLYADLCLQIQNSLFDYNLANANAMSPFQGTRFEHPINQEVIFFSGMLSNVGAVFPTNPVHARVDTMLYESYDVNDLRREVFFRPRSADPSSGFLFKGSYSFRGYIHYFSGLAVDEMLLVRAECEARAGNTGQALDDLNTLLIKRWREGTYEPFEGLDAQQALSLVLRERRKELLFRGLRWTDLRRLNQEGNDITLVRNINGHTQTLSPDDPRWIWPFPPDVLVQ